MLETLKTILSPSLSEGDPHVDIEGRSVPVRIRRNSRSKNLSLRVDTVKGEIRVTMPTYTPTVHAMAFIEKKREWIAARLESAPDEVPLVPGQVIAIEGQEWLICWQAGWPRRIEQKDGELRLGGPEDMISSRIIRWLKTRARDAYQSDLHHYCGLAGEVVPRLQLGDPRSRWGSCSSRGTIALSWRLIMAPIFVRRSVVAHEVAHMRHMDHSPAFYAWMDEIYEGDRKTADQWLKMHGTALQAVGR